VTQIAPTRSYSYDAEGRQVSATISSGTTNYIYDGDGRRVQKVAPTGTTTYVYDATGQLAAEYTTAPPTDSGTRYLTADHLGSTALVTDSGGNCKATYDYLPFGEEIATGYAGRTFQCYAGQTYPSTPDILGEKFTGQLRDSETGLDFFDTRYISSAQGRFTSPDKPFADQNTPDPQSWNMYAYVRNNPLRFVDPDGRECRNNINENGDVCFTATAHASWLGTFFSNVGSFLKGTGEEATVNTFLGATNTIDLMRQMSYGGPDFRQPLIHATTSSEQYGQYAGMIVPLFIPGGEVEETVTLFRAVSRGEAAQVLAEGAFKAGESSLGGKFFAEKAGDASKWGDLLQGPGNYEVIRVEIPKSAADSLMRWERLDGIGPARYGELNQINVPGLKVVGK
jgi:RHS repeat-associated protein